MSESLALGNVKVLNLNLLIMALFGFGPIYAVRRR